MPELIGVLALQGDYELHFRAIERAGGERRKVRLPADLEGLHGLIIPGGESTTMVRLAKAYGLFEALRSAGSAGMPMFGTCAGAIVLGRGAPDPERLGLVPVDVRRNAYGRQRESFEKPLRLDIGGDDPFTCVFIRAPKIEAAGDPDVKVLGKHGADPVLVRWRDFLLATFHPELTRDLRIHRMFLDICAGHRGRAGKP